MLGAAGIYLVRGGADYPDLKEVVQPFIAGAQEVPSAAVQDPSSSPVRAEQSSEQAGVARATER